MSSAVPGIIPDKAIVLFLYDHGVQASPPDKPNLLMDGLVSGITASEGFTAQATAHSARQLSKNARLDDWRSWKQWALSHQDWPDWYSAYVEKTRLEEEEQKLRKEEQLKKEMEEAGCNTVEEFKSHLEKKERNILLIVFIGLPLLLAIMGAIAGLQKKPSGTSNTNRTSTQTEKKYSPAIEACVDDVRSKWTDGQITSSLDYQQGTANCYSSSS